ncbi:major capsid protein [Capybara microvirus Cap3_SP_383]|nr:major capsid protein [Capybara microvirus Cap3_SP_383]
MNNDTQKVRIKDAVSHSRINLDESHLTTTDFGQLQVLYSRSVLPGDKFDFKGNIFARTAPLVYPAYVNAHYTAVSVFVPYYQVWDDWEAFASGVTTSFGRVVNNVPYIYQRILDDLFTTVTSSTTDMYYQIHRVLHSGSETPSQWTENYDAVCQGTDNKFYYFAWTDKGKFFLKLLNSLGYRLSSSISRTDSTITGSQYLGTTGAGSIKLSIMPLLCLLKAYVDWFGNNKTIMSTTAASLLRDFKNGTKISLTASDLFNILDTIRLLYDTDWMTTAWQQPNKPITTYGSAHAILPTNNPMFSYHGEMYSDNDVSTDMKLDANRYLSNQDVRVLNALDKYVRRNNLAGSKAAARALSRFGIKTTDFKSNYTDILDIANFPLQIGDVTATNGTDEQPLGSFAGKSFTNGQIQVKQDFRDYGQFMVIGFISVKNSFPYGVDTDVLKVNPLDFYTPEYDGIGTQALRYSELYSNPKMYDDTQWNSTKAFGFSERYYEYRTPKDRITGDMVLYDDFLPWHTARDLSGIVKGSKKAMSDDVIYYPIARSEFDRIFAMNAGDDEIAAQDHFFMSCYFKLSAVRPILDLSGSYQLGEGDIEMNKDGLVVS